MTTGELTKVWRGTAGDRANMAVSNRLLRTRIATLTERDHAGLPRDEPAKALAIRTCAGPLVTAVPDRASKTSFAMIANGLAIRWERPFAEVAQLIGAILAADDKTLGDLSTALISTRATCRKAECQCGARYAPLIAGMVPDDGAMGAAFDDLKALKGHPDPAVMQSERVRQDAACTRILAAMRVA